MDFTLSVVQLKQKIQTQASHLLEILEPKIFERNEGFARIAKRLVARKYGEKTHETIIFNTKNTSLPK